MKFGWFLAALVGLSLGMRAALAAEIVIIESTVPGIEAGSIVADTDAITVPAGELIVIVEEDGSSRTIEGPFKGAIGSAGEAAGGGLIANLGKLVQDREKSRQVLGAIRAAPGQIAPEVFLVDVGRSGIACVPDGEMVTLWRPETLGMETEFTLEAATGTASTRVLWPENVQTLDWPGDLAAKDGAVYRARLMAAPRPAEITLRRIPAELASDAERIAWMIEAGCRRQARLALEALTGGG